MPGRSGTLAGTGNAARSKGKHGAGDSGRRSHLGASAKFIIYKEKVLGSRLFFGPAALLLLGKIANEAAPLANGLIGTSALCIKRQKDDAKKNEICEIYGNMHRILELLMK